MAGARTQRDGVTGKTGMLGMCGLSGFAGLFRQLSAALVVGMCAHWVWAYNATVLVDALFFSSFSNTDLSNALYYIVSVGFYCAAMGLYGIVAGYMWPQLSSYCTSIAKIAPVCTALCTMCLPFCDAQTAGGALLCVVAGVGTGIGSGLMYAACWGEVYGSRPTSGSVFNFTLSILSAVAFTWACATFLPHAATVVVTVCLPLVEGVCAVFALKAVPAFGSVEPVESGEPGVRGNTVAEQRFRPVRIYTQVRLGSFVLWVCLPLMFAGMSTGVLREFSLHPIMAEGGETALGLVVALVAAFALIVIVLVLLREDVNLLARAALLVSALVLALIVSQVAGELAVLNAVLVGYICLDAVTWATPCDLTYRYGVSPALAFGLCRMAVALGIGVGNGVIKLTVGAEVAYAASNTAVPLSMLILFIVAYGFWPQDKTLRKNLLKGGETETSAVDGVLGSPGEVAADVTTMSRSAVPVQPASVREPVSKQGACLELADKCGLSQRECEILTLFVSGRDTRFISDKLGISTNTAKSHIQHIYQKIGVHTKQELITLVETMGEDGPTTGSEA